MPTDELDGVLGEVGVEPFGVALLVQEGPEEADRATSVRYLLIGSERMGAW